VAAAVVPRAAGGWVVATERGFAFIDEGGVTDTLPDVWSDSMIRMNDGACDPQGRFYCGSMAYNAEVGRGALYRLEPDRSVQLVRAGVTISNGIDWSPDGEFAYYVDSPTQRIDVCSPELSVIRTLVQIDTESGMPDGLTVDSDGGIWVALWGGGAVHRYTADGSLDAVIRLPVRQPTSCAFGGDDLGTLFITTSALDLDDPEPEAGAIFAVQTGVRGLATHAFAG
jgi:sugar lactone lactonase YvrE